MSINEYDQWLGVELRHLAALEAVAQEESFGRAARRLGYTQSAVSQQIAQLEKVVGAKLVERPGGPRAVSLTDAGRLLLRHADAIVARLAAAQAVTAARHGGATGPSPPPRPAPPATGTPPRSSRASRPRKPTWRRSRPAKQAPCASASSRAS